jgi:hypothetical protein
VRFRFVVKSRWLVPFRQSRSSAHKSLFQQQGRVSNRQECTGNPISLLTKHTDRFVVVIMLAWSKTDNERWLRRLFRTYIPAAVVLIFHVHVLLILPAAKNQNGRQQYVVPAVVVVPNAVNTATTTTPSANILTSTTRRESRLIAVLEPPHPHAGARYPNGTIGYIVDPSPLRLRPEWAVPCPNLPATASRTIDTNNTNIEGDGGRLVLEKVRQGLLRSLAASSSSSASRRSNPTQSQPPPPRILCMVYTYEGSHDRLAAIAETWGRRCDGFFAASNATDEEIGALDLTHAGDESYGNMWQKIRSTWAYAYDHFLHEYDYFHICGDDVYMVMDNLRAFLGSKQVRQLEAGPWEELALSPVLFAPTSKWTTVQPRPLLFGAPALSSRSWKCTFPFGGPGYTLNRRALQLFGEEGLATFHANETSSKEDMIMGQFFCSQGIWTSDNRDATGAWRYGGIGDAQEHSEFYGGPTAMQSKRLSLHYPGYSYPSGLEGVSEESVSFHLKNPGRRGRVNRFIPQLIRRYHQILYRSESCDLGVKPLLGL